MMPREGTPMKMLERKAGLTVFALRVLALAFSLGALIAMATSKQHRSLSVSLPGIRGIGFEKSADYGYSSAFKYIVGATAIAAVYALLQAARSLATIHLLTTSDITGLLPWLTLLGDQAMTYLLLAAAAASTEVVYPGDKSGQSKVAWVALCVVFSSFCKHVVTSIALTFLATIVFSVSTLFSAYELFAPKLPR